MSRAWGPHVSRSTWIGDQIVVVKKTPIFETMKARARTGAVVAGKALATVLRLVASRFKTRTLLLMLLSLPVMSIFYLSFKQHEWSTAQYRRGAKCVAWHGTVGCLAMA